MRGRLKFSSRAPETAALAYVQRLADLLREEEPKTLEIRGSSVYVRSGVLRLVSNWNLLACVTSATIDAIPGHREVQVRYRIRVTILVVFCIFATLVGSGVALAFGHLSIVGKLAIVVWGGLFCLNYLILWRRMTSLFRKVAKEVVQGEQPPEPQGRLD